MAQPIKAKEKKCRIDAQWAEWECPQCKAPFVIIDRFGSYCAVCGWDKAQWFNTEDRPLTRRIRRDMVELTKLENTIINNQAVGACATVLGMAIVAVTGSWVVFIGIVGAMLWTFVCVGLQWWLFGSHSTDRL